MLLQVQIIDTYDNTLLEKATFSVDEEEIKQLLEDNDDDVDDWEELGPQAFADRVIELIRDDGYETFTG